MSDYEPGTVAVATVRGVKGVRVYRYRSSAWVSARPVDQTRFHGDTFVTDIRPLVVVDLDDPAEFARILRGVAMPGRPSEGDCKHIINGSISARRLTVIADQIEAQTKPPRIPEPTGLAAVVKDSNGDKWIRHDSVDDCEDASACIPWRRSKWGNTARWDDFHAVEVLSEGLS